MTASHPPGPTIPAPRPSPEHPGGPGHPDHASGARAGPGWLTLVEALDKFAAAMVARLEHQLTGATAEDLARLRRQLTAARRLEATTSAAAMQARRAPAPPVTCPPPG